MTSLLFVSANQLYASEKKGGERGLARRLITTCCGVAVTHISEQVKKSSNASNDKSLKSDPLAIVSNTQSADKSGSDRLILNNEKPKNQVLLIEQNNSKLKDPNSFIYCYNVDTKGADTVHDIISDQTYNAEPHIDDENNGSQTPRPGAQKSLKENKQNSPDTPPHTYTR